MSRPTYATREDLKSALDSAETARNNLLIDAANLAAAEGIDAQMARQFYPTYGTKSFDWPDPQMGTSYRLWLDRQELISVESVVTGGLTVPADQYILQPNRTGPPYRRLELNLSFYGYFGGNSVTPQNAITITGWWGFTNATTAAGTLTALASSGATSIAVSDSALVGVGDALLIEDEYLLVTDRRMADTSQTGTLTKDTAAVTLAVADGTAYDVGEVLLLDSERVLVLGIAGNSLTVKRAWDGTVLAAHSAAPIWAARTLVVERGALGTAAQSHAQGAAVSRHKPPSLIRQLAIAEAEWALQQEGSAYQAVQQRARQVGASGSARGAMTQVFPIDDLRVRVETAYARQARTRVV